jgi:hypothetical protein
MIIEIILKTDDGEVIGKKETRGFEAAYEDLGKLERYWDKYEEKLERDDAIVNEAIPTSRKGDTGNKGDTSSNI